MVASSPQDHFAIYASSIIKPMRTTTGIVLCFRKNYLASVNPEEYYIDGYPSPLIIDASLHNDHLKTSLNTAELECVLRAHFS